MPRTLMSAPPTERVGRYPKHVFNTKEMVYQATPFMIAPVLPGETMKNLYFESRVVTDPVLNSRIGWKKEYFFFYVRITDLMIDGIRDMFVDPTNTDLAGTLGSAGSSRLMFQAKGGIPYMNLALTRIVDTFFRDEGTVSADFVSAISGAPFVQIRDRFWLDSLTDKDDMPGGDAPSSATNAEELQALMAAYEQLRSLGIANMTYEDFLRSYGVAIPSKDENKPELLAHFSDFQYPSNTVDPTDGSVASAVSWVFKNGKRDPKYFKEPGFVVGISITRPKVYYKTAGNLSGFLSRAWDWVPNYLNEAAADPMPFTSLKKFAADTGPLGDSTDGGGQDAYWVDMRDLFVHGDMFQNVSGWNDDGANPAFYSEHIVQRPVASSVGEFPYISDNIAKGLFVDSAGTNFYVRQDGYVSLSIQGRQVDYTVGNLAEV